MANHPWHLNGSEGPWCSVLTFIYRFDFEYSDNVKSVVQIGQFSIGRYRYAECSAAEDKPMETPTKNHQERPWNFDK